jgi:hypothetical protein
MFDPCTAHHFSSGQSMRSKVADNRLRRHLLVVDPDLGTVTGLRGFAFHGSATQGQEIGRIACRNVGLALQGLVGAVFP